MNIGVPGITSVTQQTSVTKGNTICDVAFPSELNETKNSSFKPFVETNDKRWTKPKTDEEILSDLKKQDFDSGCIMQEDPSVSKLNSRRKHVIALMEQGFTYEEALKKTAPKKTIWETVFPRKEKPEDPFFKEEKIFKPTIFTSV